MLFTVSSSDLHRALAKLKPATNNRELEILKSTLIEVKEGGIQLLAFNLSQGISTRIGADVREGGEAIAVPHSILSSIVTNLEGDLEIGSTDSLLHIKSDRSNFKISLPDAREYPAIPVVETPVTEFNFAEIGDLFRDCTEVAADDLSRQILTGVCLTPREDGFEVAATDSHRLLVRNSFVSAISESQVIFPADLLTTVLTTFKDEESLNFAASNNLVRFSSNATSLIGRVLEGSYPKYNALIPNKFQQEIAIDAERLRTGIKTVNPLSSNKTVKLSILQGSLHLLSMSEIGEARTEIPITGYTQNLDIAFNADYLLDALKPLKGEVTLKLNQNNSPMLVCSDNYTHLLMPTQKDF
jgi:DNA polymerase-3 subunit beta